MCSLCCKQYFLNINVFFWMFILFRAIPGCLGSLGHFKNKYSYPIEQGQKHSTTKRTLAIGRKTVKALVRKISIWFLRRTKVHIKEQLPKKDDRVGFFCSNENSSSRYTIVLFRWRSAVSKCTPPAPWEILWCFSLGGVLFSNWISAECVSDSAGHWRCEVTAEVFREMSLSKWTYPHKLLL